MQESASLLREAMEAYFSSLDRHVTASDGEARVFEAAPPGRAAIRAAIARLATVVRAAPPALVTIAQSLGVRGSEAGSILPNDARWIERELVVMLERELRTTAERDPSAMGHGF